MKKIFLFLIFSIILCSCKEEIKKEKTTKDEPIKVIQEDLVLEDETTSIIKPNYNLNKDLILGKFNYKKDTNFVKVDTKHSTKSLYLNKQVYNAFKKMYESAKESDVNLKIVSGTRSFVEQKYIWERKWEKYKNLEPLDRAKKILEYSSMPSSSRHHWGTDIDINNLNNSYFEKGKGKKEYDWLVANANSYGFYLVYTLKDNGRTGYNLEKWHWSYLPLAKEYLSFFNENITYKDINGFKGAELAEEVKIISNYVNGISFKIKQHLK